MACATVLLLCIWSGLSGQDDVFGEPGGLEKMLVARVLNACPRSLPPLCLESRLGAEARHAPCGWFLAYPHRRGGGGAGADAVPSAAGTW